jgi:hypothetical protein
MAAVAHMERTGIPIDRAMFDRLRDNWETIRCELIRRLGARFDVFVPRERGGPAVQFSEQRFAALLARHRIPWPKLPSGRLCLDEQTFKDMGKRFPDPIGALRDLRHGLSQLKLRELQVGKDNRNRTLLGAFGTKTGRNAPSNSGYAFGPAVWMRSVIKPEPGRALAYIDWTQQEIAIAAYLSGDVRMQEIYRAGGDLYMNVAVMVGCAPPGATKHSHPGVREQFKTLTLGMGYGMTAFGLARRLGVPLCVGQDLLRRHQQAFPKFWEWSNRVETEGFLGGRLRSVFGWPLHVTAATKPRTLRNFPCQSNGSEMLRLAACLCTEGGIQVCGPVHDALLVEAPTAEIETTIAQAQACMRQASEWVLPGFPVRTEAKVVRYPDRYHDPRGRVTWETVMSILDGLPEDLSPVIGSDLSPVIG